MKPLKIILTIALIIVSVTVFSQDPRFTTRHAKNWASAVDDSLDNYSADINTNTTNITSNDADILINKTQLQDSLGWQFVDAATYGDGVTDATAHIQSKIDEVKHGILYLPIGKYFVDSLLVQYSTTIIGAGWSRNDSASAIYSIRNKDIITFSPKAGAVFNYGPSVENLIIEGGSDADSSGQHGVVINGDWAVKLERVNVVNCGGYGVYFAKESGTWGSSIENCNIRRNNLGGIYGRSTATSNINAITIKDSYISNYGYGINLIGTNIIIRDNIIELNDSSGIFMSALDLGNTISCNSNNTVIDGNYFEHNGGGDIYIDGYYNADPLAQQFHYNTTINNNYIYNESASIDKPGVDALITINDRSGNNYTTQDLYIGSGNKLASGGVLKYVDARSKLDHTSFVYISEQANYEGLNFSGFGINGVAYGGPRYQTVVAGTGITAAKLSPFMWIANSGNIDITADPQITGGQDGQRIVLFNGENNNFTLDDGTGLNLTGQFVMGQGDSIELIYFNGNWIELTRSDN